jgi:hypothetical protein
LNDQSIIRKNLEEYWISIREQEKLDEVIQILMLLETKGTLPSGLTSAKVKARGYIIDAPEYPGCTVFEVERHRRALA